MKTGTTSHPKFRSLQKRLELPVYAVVGILETVWMMAGQFADDGDLSRFTDDQIADAVDWPGDGSDLVEALVEHRWLDRTKNGVSVHDWLEHCPKYVQDRLSKRQKRADQKQVVETCRRKSATVAENRGLPNPTQPDPIELKNIALSVSRSEPAFSGFRFPVKAKGAENWPLPVDKLNEYVETYGDRIWVEAELRKARQWCNDNIAKRKTPGGMLPFLGRWLASANDKGRSRTAQLAADELPEMKPKFTRSGHPEVSR
ncbi:hypothetical protein [Neorhodopirellula pilleata]|uniref:Lin1244/Lin1753-like N-terminal domain-containing protein n=1 Tax=Neorhodopirellula pilleata TaxID=2714738 RepID=A0A5C5ZVR2_9BACT|nr:hypothetical protein [Neorhodopirellula pilleata]TWT91654.1 hypothetical protein Pla100_50720 [Neorhodopirellula pilleata]